VPAKPRRRSDQAARPNLSVCSAEIGSCARAPYLGKSRGWRRLSGKVVLGGSVTSISMQLVIRGRNSIERMFSRLKDFRRIVTSYVRLTINYLAALPCSQYLLPAMSPNPRTLKILLDLLKKI